MLELNVEVFQASCCELDSCLMDGAASLCESLLLPAVTGATNHYDLKTMAELKRTHHEGQ